MIDFFEYYKNQGHVFGECMSHPNTDLIYVNIPKNASSWTKKVFVERNWEFYNYHTDNLYFKQALVVLRDPVERWISGIAEYMYLRHRDLDTGHVSNAFLNLVFDRIAFDDHTESQVLFLQNLNLSNCVFFWCDKNYRQNFSHYLQSKNMPNNYHDYEYQHVTKDEPVRSKFQKIFRQALENNSKYNQQLQWYFAKDYNLIDSVKFYAG